MIGLYAEASYLLVLRIRKNQRDSIREQENKHVLPGSIIAVVATGVNRFCSFEQTASVGPGALERGDRAVGSSRDHTNQCVSSRWYWTSKNKRCFNACAS